MYQRPSWTVANHNKSQTIKGYGIYGGKVLVTFGKSFVKVLVKFWQGVRYTDQGNDRHPTRLTGRSEQPQ